MLSSTFLRQPQLGLLGSHTLRVSVAAATRCLSPRLSSPTPTLPSQLVRRVANKAPSSKPLPASRPTSPNAVPAPKSDQNRLRVPRLVVYHYTAPRVLFLGALKLTTIFVFSFFTVMVVPGYVQGGAPLWATAGLVAASTIPFLAVWYLTSPMVMWIHMRLPQEFLKNPQRLDKYIEHLRPDTELAITTMGVLGKPRVSRVKLEDLRYEKRRFGLVNYTRDTSTEDAKRKWYQFRAVSEFRIEDEASTAKKSKQPWKWYTIMRDIRQRQAQRAQIEKVTGGGT